jgi:hypothetical protein
VCLCFYLYLHNCPKRLWGDSSREHTYSRPSFSTITSSVRSTHHLSPTREYLPNLAFTLLRRCEATCSLPHMF